MQSEREEEMTDLILQFIHRDSEIIMESKHVKDGLLK